MIDYYTIAIKHFIQTTMVQKGRNHERASLITAIAIEVPKPYSFWMCFIWTTNGSETTVQQLQLLWARLKNLACCEHVSYEQQRRNKEISKPYPVWTCFIHVQYGVYIAVLDSSTPV